MKIRQFGHAAFKCGDLEASVAFYRDRLGFPEKFRLYYGDLARSIRENSEKTGEPLQDDELAVLEAKKDRTWIAYLELAEGTFIELFDPDGARYSSRTEGKVVGYQHFALVVDDIHALRDELIQKGIEIDRGPSFGLEGTWQMWIRDPDGNQIEWMQYTDASMQLTGR